MRRHMGAAAGLSLRAFLHLLLLSVLLTGCTPYLGESGRLKGQVTIGPLVPVAREGEGPPTPSPQVFAAREIVVYGPDGETLVRRIQIQPDGSYRADLPAGFYVVDINRIGIDRAAELPKTVQIRPGRVTELNVDIDTGIR